VGVIGSTASEISAEVRSGRCSAEAVVREHLDVISAQGEITTYGSAAVSSGTAATSDHPVVARLRAAGAIVVGITRVPELCLFAFTDGPDAVTRNPWDPARTSGGSSGGSATAVAAGMVPIAHGADGLGSLRIPAACCGLVTLKPGLGTVPAGLGVGDWYGMAENGILATTVQDLALGHSVLAGSPCRIWPPGRIRDCGSARPSAARWSVRRPTWTAAPQLIGLRPPSRWQRLTLRTSVQTRRACNPGPADTRS